MMILTGIFEWILSAGLRASLLVPVVLAAQWLLRKHLPATWRYALWLPVLVALLVPTLPILPSSLTQRLSSTDAPAVPAVTQEPLSAERSLPVDRENSGFSASPPGSTTGVDSPSMTKINPRAPIDWPAIALWAWLTGAVMMGLSILASFAVTMRRVKHTALPVHPDGSLRFQMDEGFNMRCFEIQIPGGAMDLGNKTFIATPRKPLEGCEVDFSYPYKSTIHSPQARGKTMFGDYSMKLEFGAVTGRKLPGKIYLSIEKHNSHIEGEFEVSMD